MADAKVSAFTAQTTPLADDMYPLETAAGASKKIIPANLAKLMPGYQYDYVERTTTLTVTATTAATADTFVTGNAVTYDGSTTIDIRFFVPYLNLGDGALIVVGCLYDGASSIGQLGAWETPSIANSAAVIPGGLWSRIITPSAAAHTYSIRFAKVIGSTAAVVTPGAGGAGAYMPAYIRQVRV